MCCDVGKPTKGLENELWRRWSDGKFGEEQISNRSVASPTTTAHSPTLLSLLLRHRIFTYVTWRAAHGVPHFFKSSLMAQLKHSSREGFFLYYLRDWGRRVNGISWSLIWWKTLMELIFNPCAEFRWSPEGPVSQIHTPHLHVGAPGSFSDLLRSCGCWILRCVLTSYVISVASDIEREKSDKFC